MRYFMEIAYVGTKYHGWQIQENAHTVQAEIEKSLQTLLKKHIPITGSGRTDTGVHCTQQYAHFDTDIAINALQTTYKLNILLPKDIHIKRIFEVPNDKHARFDATSRAYEYRIMTEKNPFLQGFASYIYADLDWNLIQEASLILLEYKDFQCFSKVKTQVNHFECDIMRVEWEFLKDKHRRADIILHIKANRFLRGMVRAIVGTLLDVGRGKLSKQDFREIIIGKNRQYAGKNASAEGLFLVEVEY